ncbi:hypothetical protein [Aerococcus mictus]
MAASKLAGRLLLHQAAYRGHLNGAPAGSQPQSAPENSTPSQASSRPAPQPSRPTPAQPAPQPSQPQGQPLYYPSGDDDDWDDDDWDDDWDDD